MDLLELCGGSSVNESEFLLSDILTLIPNFMVNQFLELKQDERSLKKLMKIIDECVERMLEKDVLVPKGKNQGLNKFSSVINWQYLFKISYNKISVCEIMTLFAWT